LKKEVHHFTTKVVQQEQVISQLMRIVAHTNKKVSDLEEKIKQIEIRVKN